MFVRKSLLFGREHALFGIRSAVVKLHCFDLILHCSASDNAWFGSEDALLFFENVLFGSEDAWWPHVEKTAWQKKAA